MRFLSSSVEETHQIGREIAQLMARDELVCFFGELGAGKTTLIQAIASEIASISPYAISSPTFSYLNIYEGKRRVCHFDCYRLGGVKDFLERGLDDYWGDLCLIEWAEKIAPILPPRQLHIHLNPLAPSVREIACEKNYL